MGGTGKLVGKGKAVPTNRKQWRTSGDTDTESNLKEVSE